MDTQNIQIGIVKDTLKAYDKQGKPYCFSIIAEYDDPTKQPFKVAKELTTEKVFNEKISTAISKLKANRIVIHMYSGKTEKSATDETIVIELEDQEETSQHQDILSRVDALIKNNNQMQEDNAHLSGVVEQKTNMLSEVQHNHTLDLIKIKHQIETDRLRETIAEQKEELADLKADLQEATASLSKFQEIYNTEEKLEKGARTTAAILKGVLSVAPGLIKYAEQTGLGGLATAFISDGGMPSPGTEPAGGSSPDSTGMDFGTPEFQRMQRILGFAQSLTPEESDRFLQIIEMIERDKSILVTLAEILQTK